MTRRILVLQLAAASFVLLLAHADADIISPGTYRGYFLIDRWGHKVLNYGTSYTFVSDSAEGMLAKETGKPIEAQVTKILQPVNPGAGVIAEVTSVRTVDAPAMKLRVTLMSPTTKVTQGQGLSLVLRVENRSRQDVRLWPGALRIILATDKPFPNEAIGYEHPDDLAYWCYQHVYFDTAGGRVLRIACREDRPPWKGKYIASHGSGLRTTREPLKFVDDVVVFEPGGRFEHELVVGSRLLPGQYEAFVHLACGFPSPMSNRIAFDVVEPEEGKGPQQDDGQ